MTQPGAGLGRVLESSKAADRASLQSGRDNDTGSELILKYLS